MKRNFYVCLTKRTMLGGGLLCLIAAAGTARPGKHQHIDKTQWTVREAGDLAVRHDHGSG